MQMTDKCSAYKEFYYLLLYTACGGAGEVDQFEIIHLDFLLYCIIYNFFEFLKRLYGGYSNKSCL